MNIKENSHMGCVVVFILAAIAFVIFSVPKLKKMEAQRVIEQERKDSAAMARAWQIADSVKRERLLEDPDYVELYDENEDLKDRLKRIKEYAEEAEFELYYFEGKGYDTSDIQDNLSSIIDECE